MSRDVFRHRSPSARRLQGARGSIPLLGALVLFCAAGCPNNAPTTTPAAGGGGTAGVKTGQDADSQCAGIISSIHDTFQLQRLGQTTNVADGVLRLNDWEQSCGLIATAPVFSERLRLLLSDEQVDAVQSSRFTKRDGEHLRDGVLFRSLARRVFATDDGQTAELLRVVAAFQHVVRTIELVEHHPQDLPLTPYEIYLLGKGTSADRAWLFANLLRQAKIDAVLIAPPIASADAAEPKGPFLVGALLDGKTYLFDPRAGVAIPAPGAAESPQAATGVATLDQAADDPDVLRQLDVDEEHPYPLRSSDLQKPTVLLISDSSYWSERMRALQGQFSGEQSMILSEPLQDSADGAGLWTRVGKGGGARWSEAAVRIWAYPESQLESHLTLTDDRKEALRLAFSPFEAYWTPFVNPADGKLTLIEQEQVDDLAGGRFDPGRAKRIRTTRGAQMRARLMQAGGELAQAVQAYHEVWQRSNRLLQHAARGDLTIDEDKALLHARAVDDASFWTAACKFEQRNYRVAVDLLQRYRSQQPKGAWVRQCRYLLALSYAAQEDFQAAVDELEGVAADDPEFAGYQWLIHQWRMAEPTEEGAGDSGAKPGA